VVLVSEDVGDVADLGIATAQQHHDLPLALVQERQKVGGR